MRERFVTFPLFLLAALILTVSAFAAGESASGRVEIANRAYSGSSFSCEAQLSGGQIQGELFAVVFAESGQMKSLSDYPAAETVQVMLQGVADTDCVKILWTDEKQMPLAPPAVLRMSANNTAAYDKFAQDLAALKSFGNAADAASASADPYILGRLLVSCCDPSLLNPYKNKATIISGPDNFYVLQFRDPVEAKKCEQELQSRPSVRYVEPDVVLKVDVNAQTDETALLQTGSLSWGVEKTGIGEYAENLRKRGFNSPIVVAVVDSGVDANHPFLQGRLIDGYDYVEGDDSPQDEHGHGTHVAGTIADCTPDMNVKIMTVRVLNAFAGGSHLSIINGIDYAANHGAHIINLSLSVNWKFHQAIEDAINRALSKNITVVVAAGNGKGNAKYCSPANMEECITVAAVNSDLKRFDLSNYGDAVDIAAPGEKVTSCLPGGITGEMDGTSMAAPHVSAAAALLMCERGTGQTPFQISNLIRNAATEIPIDMNDGEWKYWKNFGETRFLGAGFLDTRPFFKRTVTFDANRGTGKMDSLSVSHGETVTLTANAFQRNGYRFLGWNTKADGSGTSYLDGASLTVSGDMTLYAQWKLIEWTVTLDANDESGKTRTVTVSVEKPFAWPDNPFSRTGYELTAWNTKADGSGTSYTNKASLTVSGNMTLYAQWKQTVLDPVPVKPISWGTTATHMDEYASFLQERGNLPEVVLAVVDTGVDASHTFFRGRLLPGYDFVDNDDNPQDEFGQGTHVAGIIADCTPDNVKIMPVRVLDAHGGGTYLNITMGIRYAAEHGAGVICLALGLASHMQIVEDAIQYAISRNITVVVAAGNHNNNASEHCPAHIADCITVAAVDKDLKRHGLSNYGEAVDIAAPGVDINSCLPDGKYGKKTGTSMATAYVSAAAAMLMCEYGTDRTPAQVSDLLKNAAMPIPDDEEDAGKSLGAGFLDMTPFIKGDAPYVMLYDDGEMVFQMGNASNPDKSLTANYPVPTEDSSAQYAAWYPVRDKIRTVTFSDAIRPVSTALWFYGCENLTEISGMENLDASQVTDMSQMFARCTSLKTLDLSAWNTGNVSNTRQMFFGCASLTAIYASDAFSVSNVTDSADMFTGCTSLIGGSGTKYDDAHTDKEYAHIDDGAYDAGYFADKTRLLFDGVELSYQAIDTAPADGDINIEVTANNTCVIGDTLVVSATVCTPDEYNAGSHKYIGYFAYQNRREWQQLRAWYIDGGASLYTLKIPVKSCPKMGSNYFVVSVFPADNFTTGASLQDCLFQVYMTQS